MSISASTQATLVGLLGPLCWGMSVGLVRRITESFGLAPGLCLLYGGASLVVFAILRFPHLRLFDKKYLLTGIPTASASATLFCLSLYLSDGGRQTIEVGMVNYLWPCLIVIFSVLFFDGRARWWLVPGVVISLGGIMTVLGGSGGIDLPGMYERVLGNPWSYGLSLLNAVFWAIYCNTTRLWSNGQNPALLVFLLDFSVFAALWTLGFGHLSGGTQAGWASLAIGAAVLGGANVAWGHGLMHGNITVLAVASYFTPVFSCLFASVWIGAELDASFYKGILILVIGSLMCWSSTRTSGGDGRR